MKERLALAKGILPAPCGAPEPVPHGLLEGEPDLGFVAVILADVDCFLALELRALRERGGAETEYANGDEAGVSSAGARPAAAKCLLPHCHVSSG